MMKGKRFIIAIVLIGILALSNYTVSQGIREDLSKPVVSAFNQTDAELLQIKVNAKSQISKEFLTNNQMSEMGQDLVDKFNIQGNLENPNYQSEIVDWDNPMYTMDLIENENMKKLIISGRDKKDNSVTIILLTTLDKYSNLEKTELIVDIISKNLKDHDGIQNNIRNIFRDIDKEPKVNTCIVGTFGGNIDNSEKMEIVSDIMKKVDAREIEKFTQPDIISVSGYSPNIDNHIYTGNNKMNLNIAMRHNYTEDKTYIWIATPIIDHGY